MDGMNQNNNPYHHNPYQPQDNQHQPQDNPYQAQNNSYQHQDNPYQAQNNPYQLQNNPGGQPAYVFKPYEQKNHSSAKIVIGVVCACAVVFGIIIGAFSYYRSTPSYKISKGFRNLAKEIVQNSNPLTDKIGTGDMIRMMQEDGGHVETTLDFTVDVSSWGNVTLGVDTDFYKDVHAKELSADTSISVMNYDFAHLNIYANDEVFCFSVPELFLEDLYVENQGLVSQYNDSFLGELYPSSMEDFSINLFPDEDKRISFRDWRNMSSSLEDLGDKIDACKEGMIIEKAGKGLYRVTFPEKESDRLLKSLLESAYNGDEARNLWKEYKNLIDSDVSLLFEINGKNRIESIILDSPIEMLDGTASLEGEIFFLGETRSIDKVQGKIIIGGADGKSRELICQIQQTSGNDIYSMDTDIKLSYENKTLGKVKVVMNCDAVKDKFDLTCSFKDDTDDMGIVLEGSFDDIVKGESLEFDLNKAAFTMNDKEYFKISGDISIEPLQSKVQASVKPKTALFEMSYTDWLGIMYQLQSEYGNVLGSLLEYLW